ncbi:2OG-Fe dioxygenase family protein [Marinobacter bohaiensis]|uniref:2OG-Fe dioxygenase family protein n=1 Tax=Marinobacter bohaiensis TaxID=2201898 RepID=UPI000DAD6C6C|nr:2OG-Fe dioxygenase family protein [Marinobacter bohaiensis]
MTAHQIQPPLAQPTIVTEASAADLIAQDYAVIPGRVLGSVLGVYDTAAENDAEWQSFAACWDRLTQDTYMGDNGRYRYRRYGRFEYRAEDDSLHLLPHQPYMQPLSVNSLNGGFQRYFDPLEQTFVASPILERLLLTMARIYAAADGYESNWCIRLHPYRITGSNGIPGKPTPEGLHRDGVTYIASMMVARRNIAGGTTRLTTNDGETLASVMLTDAMDMVLSDDERTMHEVSEIYALDNERPSYRDVLVIAFERMEAFG